MTCFLFSCGNLSTVDETPSVMYSLKQNLVQDIHHHHVEEFYTIRQAIGEGSMGSISLVQKKKIKRDRSHDNANILSRIRKKQHEEPETNDKIIKNNEYAMKSIQMGLVSSEEMIEEMRNEIDILRNLDHPNIVKAYEVFEKNRHLYVVMELCSGGNLYERVPYTEIESARVVNKILSAVSYMHKNNVVHRDLKFENILFENRSSDAEIKIIDFGLSNKFKAKETKVMNRTVGTMYTMSPQVFEGSYDHKADLWSVGVITYMLLSNTKPFAQRKRKALIVAIFNCSYTFDKPGFDHVSKEAKDFILSLLTMSPTIRLDADEALQSKWLDRAFPKNNRCPSSRTLNDVHVGLQSYSTQTGDFKKIALMILAHKSSIDDIFKLRKAFDKYDESDDGLITMGEFKKSLTEIGCLENDKEIARMFKEIDTDNSGDIHYTEFLAATIETQGRIQEERLAEAFDRIDSSGKGYISQGDVRMLLGTNFTKERVANFFKEADSDKNGKITYGEFVNAFRQTRNAELSTHAMQSDIDVDDDMLHTQ